MLWAILFTKQKWRHRHREQTEQTCGYQGGRWGGMNSETGTDTYETPLMEKEMATHSSVLAWRIPWTEETGGYSPRGHKEWT